MTKEADEWSKKKVDELTKGVDKLTKEIDELTINEEELTWDVDKETKHADKWLTKSRGMEQCWRVEQGRGKKEM